jgi:hypothetical protein
MFTARCERGSQNLEPFPWNVRYTQEWMLKEYGIGRSCPIGGIFSQFADVDWKQETDCVMEQLMAAHRGLVDFPKAGFQIKRVCVPLHG